MAEPERVKVPLVAFHEPVMPFLVGERKDVLPVGIVGGDLNDCGFDIGIVNIGDCDG